MRITNGMIRNNTLSGLYTNMSRLDKLYTQMSTLKKIQRPSDDPIIAGRALKLKINVLEVKQYKSNTDEATAWMSVTEKALDNITEITKDIRTRCVQASTDSLTEEDREKIQADIDQLWEQLQQESNATYLGKYVFSGYKTNQSVVLTEETTLSEDVSVTAPTTLLKGTKLTGNIVSASGNTYLAGSVLAEDVEVAIGQTLTAGTVLPKGSMNPNVRGQVDDQTIRYEIGVGSTMTVNTLGMDDVMHKLMMDIKEIKDALATYTDGTEGNEADLHTVFEGKLTDFDDRLAKISEMTADLGSRMVRLEYTAERLEEDKTNFTELLSKTEDVDLEEVYTEFNAQYAVYQSALQATSKVIMNTLADFLR